MSNFACPNSPIHIFINIGAQLFSLAPPIVNIISYIYAQKSTATDRYWWRYGPSKFDSATARFDAETRQAVTRSISALICLIIHQNIEDDLVYHRANWDSDMTFLFTLFHSNSRTLWTGMSIRHHATSEVERYRSRGRKGSGPLRAELILWGVLEILHRR